MGVDNSGQYEFTVGVDNPVGLISAWIFGGGEHLAGLDNHGFWFDAAAADDHAVGDYHICLLFFHRLYSID